MVGDIAKGLGGKALESDILQKKSDFFRNFGEFLQFIGNRQSQGGSVQAGNSDNFFTVPVNSTFYIFQMIHSLTSSQTGSFTTQVFINTTNQTISFLGMRNIGHQNVTISYPIPLRINAGESLTINKNNTNTGVIGVCFVVGYIVPKEVSLQ